MDLFGPRLDRTDWPDVCGGPEHHVGAARFVPQLLRGLAGAADPAEARTWAEELDDVLHHSHSGGYLWPTELVVPYLILLGGSDGRPHAQAQALSLLAALGAGVPSSAERCPQGVGLEARTSAAVRAGVPGYYALLAAPAPLVRAAAFVVLSVLEHTALRDLTKAERLALPHGTPAVSPRFQLAAARLVATERDGLVLDRLREARTDPLFGHGNAYYGIAFEP